MSEVVLRCPHCGTVADALGECDACHEAGVRWYCANHTPARWLDSHVCAGCGATRYHGPIIHDPPPSPADASGVVEPRLIEVPSRAAFTRATTPSDASRQVERIDPHELFRRAAAASSGADASSPAEETTPAPRAVLLRPPVFGWRARLVIVSGALALFAVASVWLFAGSPVSNLVVGIGQATGLLSHVPTATTRGIEAYRAGDLATAERELADAARTYPTQALALLYLARIKVDTGDPDAAAPLFEEAVTREPDNPVVHRMLGEYHLTRAQRGPGDGSNRIYTATELIAAQEELEHAMALDPKDIRARGYHACALALGGRMVEAKIELSSAGPGPWEECVIGEGEK